MVAARRPDTLASCVEHLRQGGWLADKGDPARDAYAAALREEASGDLQAARKSWYSVIQQHPASGYIPLAYLGFAEAFAAESKADPSKRDLARMAYLEVAKYPPPANQAFAYATLRLAQIDARNDAAKALASFKRALESTYKTPDALCAEPISAAARQGVVESYAEVGRPDRAGDFLRSAAPAHIVELTVGLAREYVRRGDNLQAVEVLIDALRREPGLELCAEGRELLHNRGVPNADLATTLRLKCGP